MCYVSIDDLTYPGEFEMFSRRFHMLSLSLDIDILVLYPC